MSFLSPAAAEIVAWHVPGHPQADGNVGLSFPQLDRPRVLEIGAAAPQTWEEPLDSRHICRSESTSSFHLPPPPKQQKTLTNTHKKTEESWPLPPVVWMWGGQTCTWRSVPHTRKQEGSMSSSVCPNRFRRLSVVPHQSSAPARYRCRVSPRMKRRRPPRTHFLLSGPFLLQRTLLVLLQSRHYNVTHSHKLMSLPANVKVRSRTEALFDFSFFFLQWEAKTGRSEFWLNTGREGLLPGYSRKCWLGIITCPICWPGLRLRADVWHSCCRSNPGRESSLMLLIRGGQPISKCIHAGAIPSSQQSLREVSWLPVKARCRKMRTRLWIWHYWYLFLQISSSFK